MSCSRCSSQIDSFGFCLDVACPFSDHIQRCHYGWAGHLDFATNYQIDTFLVDCFCKKINRDSAKACKAKCVSDRGEIVSCIRHKGVARRHVGKTLKGRVIMWRGERQV